MGGLAHSHSIVPATQSICCIKIGQRHNGRDSIFSVIKTRILIAWCILMDGKIGLGRCCTTSSLNAAYGGGVGSCRSVIVADLSELIRDGSITCVDWCTQIAISIFSRIVDDEEGS